MGSAIDTVLSYLHKYFSISTISVTDIIEIIIIAICVYKILAWMKKGKAWTLLKGAAIVFAVVILAAIFQMSAISWIAENALGVGILGIIILFQPEFRRMFEQIGNGRTIKKIFRNNDKQSLILSEEKIDSLVIALEGMAEEHTGALVSIEREHSLEEYESTGIKINGEISKQLISNIFVNKTPLHDGAVIIRDGVIAAATCYLPMPERTTINKKYGTRHRAAVGLSEVTDAVTVVVSEETGEISLAVDGKLYENLTESELRRQLIELLEKK